MEAVGGLWVEVRSVGRSTTYKTHLGMAQFSLRTHFSVKGSPLLAQRGVKQVERAIIVVEVALLLGLHETRFAFDSHMGLIRLAAGTTHVSGMQAPAICEVSLIA